MREQLKWTNQVAEFAAQDFVKQDQGRQEPGSGRPTLRKSIAAIGGHHALVFRRQELVNHHEDAFDHLLTGNGDTWLAVIRVYRQVLQLKDVNSFFGSLRNGGNYEGIWGNLTDDNRLWIGSRNGRTFGRWDDNNPMVVAPQPLEEGRYHCEYYLCLHFGKVGNCRCYLACQDGGRVRSFRADAACSVVLTHLPTVLCE